MIQILSRNFLPLLKKHLPTNPLIVEAGAFTGTDTKKMGAYWPASNIYAFEPVPEIFDELALQTSAYANVTCHQMALSNTAGTAPLYLSEHPKRPGKICQAGTLHRPKERLRMSPIVYPQTIMVPTITLDEWAEQNRIQKIDFLWLDLQGHELAALQGGVGILKTVLLVYLEVNFIEAYEGQPSYQELDEWMQRAGFIPIARDFNDESTWFFGNVLYLRK